MARSFLDRFSPNRDQSKVIDWPFEADGEERPKVRVAVLGDDKMEEAHLATLDHVTDEKGESTVTEDDLAFRIRERVAQVWLAYSDAETGKPITDSIDELAKAPREAITVLYVLWTEVQSSAVVVPRSKEDIEGLVEELKKKPQEAPLNGLSSRTLIALLRTLASQFEASPPPKASGGGQ